MDRIQIKRHVGYSSSYSPERNVIVGRNAGENYLEIGKQLQALANLQQRTNPHASRRFHESAMLAYKRHSERGR